MWYILVFILGLILGAFETLLMVGVGNADKEQEAYREGYEDGMANAKKGENA